MKPSYEELEAKLESVVAENAGLKGVVEKASDIAKAGIEELQSQNAELAVQLANAESKCRELAAENAHARERHVFIRALAISILEHSGGRMDWRGAMEDATELLQTVDSVYAKTPATDAFLAEVRAQGVEMFAEMYACEAIKDGEVEGWKSKVSNAASEYATQLRQGAAQ
ncbi:hypothetical protein OGV58_11080 [Citrobacter sp. Cf097]|uniref:hypothetical protein n=1 Tax=Citrobacter sp. Cf097 TaxID=2985059 RepID=UPI0025779456|nr:hypothetical protein [Citrobacter sp. Cf097]EKH7704088.1 hypothetical protein [Salmonella enterica]MDM3202554.1 hypothetical protein [Citrobacter sp. Cf097]